MCDRGDGDGGGDGGGCFFESGSRVKRFEVINIILCRFCDNIFDFDSRLLRAIAFSCCVTRQKSTPTAAITLLATAAA